MDLGKLMSNINSAKQELANKVDSMINEELKLEKGAIYYYKCNGSGYYFIFNKICNEYILGDIVSKGGKLKNKEFRLHWCYVKQLDKVEKVQ